MISTSLVYFGVLQTIGAVLERSAPKSLSLINKAYIMRLMKNEVIQTILHRKLAEIRKKNPQYSTRAYAKKLGMSSGALTEILNGTRTVSKKIAERISIKLTLDPMERSNVMKDYITAANKKRVSKEQVEYLKLSMDQFAMMSEWYYFAILSMMQTRGFESSVEFVAERLGLSVPVVEKAIERMNRLGMITISEDGTWTRSKGGHRTTDDLANVSIQKNHFQTLELAKKALEEKAVEERDFTSLTLPLDYEDLPEAKQMIRKFQNDLFERFNGAKQSQEVFRVAMQLFPLTKKSEVKKREKK
jgi:uncharacterized protein (TIGR02147 family)